MVVGSQEESVMLAVLRLLIVYIEFSSVTLFSDFLHVMLSYMYKNFVFFQFNKWMQPKPGLVFFVRTRGWQFRSLYKMQLHFVLPDSGGGGG